jgi:Dullard-like phosphatase family protein
VLDLDETLVHSTFEPVTNADLVLPVRIQGMTYKINVIKRPGAEEFLARVGDLFEVVVFTASLSEYAEPLVKHLDPTGAVTSLLYRQHCTPLNGIYVKDMALLGRDMKDIILVDNSPNSFLFQPENAYHIKNFFDDKHDRELDSLMHFLEQILDAPDVRPVEDLRKRYQPQHAHQNPIMKFLHFKRESLDSEESSRTAKGSEPKMSPKRKDEKDKNAETEPDLRREDREEEFQSYRSGNPEKVKIKPAGGFYLKAAPLTERIAVNDRLMDNIEDSSVEIELPSPKESDALIHHKLVNNYSESNSNENDTDPKESAPKTNKKAPLMKSKSTLYGNQEMVTADDPTLEGHVVEEVRFHTGIDNLNSPLGKQVKIEFASKVGVGS